MVTGRCCPGRAPQLGRSCRGLVSARMLLPICLDGGKAHLSFQRQVFFALGKKSALKLHSQSPPSHAPGSKHAHSRRAAATATSPGSLRRWNLRRRPARTRKALMSKAQRKETAFPCLRAWIPRGRWGWVQFELSHGVAGTACPVLHATKK